MSKKNKKQNKPALQTSSTHDDVAKQVDQKVLDEQQSRKIVQSSFDHYSGPIPPPALLERYEDILPGATDRIISMAENQLQHRHHMEKGLFEMENRNSKLGLWFGFLIGMTTVILGGVGIALGQPWGGGFLGTAGLTGLVYVFVYGSRERRKEREAVQAQRQGSEGRE